MRTFLEMFPHATLWNGGTLMAGTVEPLRVSRAAFEADWTTPSRGERWKTYASRATPH